MAESPPRPLLLQPLQQPYLPPQLTQRPMSLQLPPLGPLAHRHYPRPPLHEMAGGHGPHAPEAHAPHGHHGPPPPPHALHDLHRHRPPPPPPHLHNHGQHPHPHPHGHGHPHGHPPGPGAHSHGHGGHGQLAALHDDRRHDQRLEPPAPLYHSFPQSLGAPHEAGKLEHLGPPPPSPRDKKRQLRKYSQDGADVDALGRKKPKIPRTPTSWDPHDDHLLRHLKEQQKLGWKDIANHFVNRTPNACQFRWRRLMSGSLRGGGAGGSASASTSASGSPTSASGAAALSSSTSPTSSASVLSTSSASSASSGTSADYDAAEGSPPPLSFSSISSVSSTTSQPATRSKPWTAEEDGLVGRKDLRFEELSVLLPTRTEAEIWARMAEIGAPRGARRAVSVEDMLRSGAHSPPVAVKREDAGRLLPPLGFGDNVR
ncbi:uncharacterized protein V1510DRAFT_404502 [Dipodascopsis tothii]|uniref:uncharacterized protein n=1 Tax=Dipodascopsis tothii TaxID=44089 RepID=UPI0034CDDFCC